MCVCYAGLYRRRAAKSTGQLQKSRHVHMPRWPRSAVLSQCGGCSMQSSCSQSSRAQSSPEEGCGQTAREGARGLRRCTCKRLCRCRRWLRCDCRRLIQTAAAAVGGVQRMRHRCSRRRSRRRRADGVVAVAPSGSLGDGACGGGGAGGSAGRRSATTAAGAPAVRRALELEWPAISPLQPWEGCAPTLSWLLRAAGTRQGMQSGGL